MIIGIDISRANRPKKTGVEWYVFFLIQEMKKLAMEKKEIQEVKFRLYSDTPVSGVLGELPENWEIKVLKWWPRRFWTQIRLSIEMCIHKPDILFIPAHVPPVVQPKKTVMTIHDIAGIRYPESYSHFERWYSVFSAKQAMRSSWKMITPSQFTKDELQRNFGSSRSKDIVVIPHGYDMHFRPLDQEEAKKIATVYGVTQPFLMSIGRMESKKNTARIIDAFHILKSSGEEELQKLQLLLVGKPGYGYESVAQAIEHSPYRDDIIIPGWVAQEHVPALMNAASVFVFPSIYEGFGLPILEAMACGTPVVTTTGHAAQEVGGRAAIYIHPERTEDIALATRRLLLDTKFRHAQIEAGLRQVTAFSWERAAQKTLQVLMSS